MKIEDIIPSNWNVSNTKTSFNIKQGKSLSAKNINGDGKKEFLRTSNVLWGKVDLSHLDKMQFTNKEMEVLKLKKGDLLICEGGDIGRTAIWEGQKQDIYYQNHLHRVRAKSKNIDPYFAMFWYLAAVKQFRLLEGLGNKTTIPNLSKSRLGEVPIPTPPLPEQKKIAFVLRKIQSAIEVQEKLIAKTKELKKSTMQFLFTHGTKGEKTKMTEIGEIPESWEINRIDSLGDIITGTTPLTKMKEYYEGGGYQFIAPNDLGKTTKIYSSEREISKTGLLVSRVLPKNAICFVCIGSTIGKVGITVVENSTTNQQINSIIASNQFDPKYIVYLLTYYSKYIADRASPNPVPILSKGKFSEINISLTKDKNEQKKIAQMLSSIDAKIENYNFIKVLTSSLFKSLLNNLMTGKIILDNMEFSDE